MSVTVIKMKSLIYQTPWMGGPPPPDVSHGRITKLTVMPCTQGGTKKNVSQRTRHKQKNTVLSKTLYIENLLSYEVV